MIEFDQMSKVFRNDEHGQHAQVLVAQGIITSAPDLGETIDDSSLHEAGSEWHSVLQVNYRKKGDQL